MGNRSSYLRYVAALGCAAAALLVRWAVSALVGPQYPFTPVFLALLACARFWGIGPAILVGLIGFPGSVWITGDSDPLRLLLSVIVAGVTIWTIEILRQSHAEAAENARLADQRLKQLREETAIRQREERLSAHLRDVVESSADAIISADLNGTIQSWNRGAEHAFGYTAAEAMRRPITMLTTLDRAHEDSDIMERIRHGGRILQFETVRCHENGAHVHVSLTISPVRDSGGETVGVSYIARDISERKKLEEQLRQTQKLESLGVLAGGLAHDFNNLLTGIIGNASLVTGDHTASTLTKTRMDDILMAGERAALLVGQMLAYAGKGQFVIDRLNLSEQVNEIMPLIKTSVSRLVDLDLHLDHKLPAIEADRSQIQQLIMNLAINAAEAIGEQHGSVTITTFFRDTDAETQVVLKVKDTGCGMTDETRSRIFDPFFTTKFTGRGLGLSAVLGIIRAHRGTISVDSAPGLGSTFTVVLPATDSAVEAVSPEGHIDLRGYGHLLVVDDEELIRKMATFTLEGCGYTVELACDGLSAVDAFSARPHSFDAVLLDLTMPLMNGEEALKRIQEIRPEIPVVLSSGYSEVEAVQRFRSINLAGFLQKPYTATALARKVKQALKSTSRS